MNCGAKVHIAEPPENIATEPELEQVKIEPEMTEPEMTEPAQAETAPVAASAQTQFEPLPVIRSAPPAAGKERAKVIYKNPFTSALYKTVSSTLFLIFTIFFLIFTCNNVFNIIEIRSIGSSTEIFFNILSILILIFGILISVQLFKLRASAKDGIYNIMKLGPVRPYSIINQIINTAAIIIGALVAVAGIALLVLTATGVIVEPLTKIIWDPNLSFAESFSNLLSDEAIRNITSSFGGAASVDSIWNAICSQISVMFTDPANDIPPLIGVLLYFFSIMTIVSGLIMSALSVIVAKFYKSLRRFVSAVQNSFISDAKFTFSLKFMKISVYFAAASALFNMFNGSNFFSAITHCAHITALILFSILLSKFEKNLKEAYDEAEACAAAEKSAKESDEVSCAEPEISDIAPADNTAAEIEDGTPAE